VGRLPNDAMPMTRPTDLRPGAWAAYLAVGVLFLLVHASMETGSIAQSFVYDGIGASAVAMAIVGVRHHRPERRLPWLLMALGQASFVAGDLLWNWYQIIGEDPFPSLADVLYLAGYPFIAAGLLLLIRRRLGAGDRGGLVDAAILTTAAVVLSWTFLMQPLVASTDLDSLGLAISLAYPVADLILIGVALGLLTTPGARTVSFGLLGGSLGLLLVADQIYAVQNLQDAYVSGGPLDTVYLVSYLLFGASALHPSMVRLSDPHPVTVTWLGPLRMAGLTIAMITGPLLLMFGPGADASLIVIAVGTALLSLLVLARLAGMVGILARDVAKRKALEAQLTYQAFHDPLTGLVNRRRFVDTAEAALSSGRRPGSVAALFLDLDDFKTVNDDLGHAAGDALLAAVADRLRSVVRASDVAARLGGDEFGVLLRDIPDVPFAESIADRLLESLTVPFTIDDVRIEIGASIGVAVDDPSVRSVDDLLGDADIAMYQAKAMGKGRHHVFSASSPEARAARARAWVDRTSSVARSAVSPMGGQPGGQPLGGARLEPGAG